jgi:myo-inositol-1(or 4)-monophosphatase
MKDPILNIAVRAARAAGNIIIRAVDRLDTVSVSEKQPHDYVTDVDQACEREIINIIHKAYPSHGILGEETGATAGDDFTWIIDPLDGTRNFMHGFPQFAVSIGVRYKKRMEYGVIYDPLRQELFTATRGKGTQLNERRVRVAKRTQLEECLLATGFPFRHSEEVMQAYLKSLMSIIPICGDVRRPGAASLDLAYVACGRFDGFWELGLKPWDFAAGVLMVKEAGAGNPKILKQLLKVVSPAFADKDLF